MARISSQGTVIKIETGPDAAPAEITTISTAKPAVITLATAPTFVVGATVVPKGTGYNSLDDRPFVVKEITSMNVTLEDSDTTKDSATAVNAGATLNAPVFTELCRSTFVINNPAGATIDVTTLCDDAHRIVSGLPAIGTWQANGFYDYNDAAMWKARDYYRSGEVVNFLVTFRDGSGLTFAGNVNVFDISAGINAAVANNIGGQISGLVSSFPPPAAPVGP